MPRCWPTCVEIHSPEALDALFTVLRAEGVKPEPLARLCGRALRASPRSTAQFSFRQHVEHFFRARGETLWGAGFDSEGAVRVFQRAAGIRPRRCPSRMRATEGL